MEAIRVEARRVPAQPLDLEADIKRAETVAKLMDSQFQIGNIKFGLDTIIGLMPAAGDMATTAIGMYPIYIARKHKLGKAIIGRMIMNLGVDFVVGLVPLVGDAIDIFVKANLKNVALLKKAAEKQRLR
jgi:hypothetical protein